MRFVEDVQSSFHPMNCNQVTVRLFLVEQDSLFFLIQNMFAHKLSSQQFGGHWERMLLSEKFWYWFQKFFGVSLPSQRDCIAGITRNSRGEYQIPAHNPPVVPSSTDHERNTVVRFAVSQHECCLTDAR